MTVPESEVDVAARGRVQPRWPWVWAVLLSLPASLPLDAAAQEANYVVRVAYAGPIVLHSVEVRLHDTDRACSALTPDPFLPPSPDVAWTSLEILPDAEGDFPDRGLVVPPDVTLQYAVARATATDATGGETDYFVTFGCNDQIPPAGPTDPAVIEIDMVNLEYPIANAGMDFVVHVWEQATLDGTGSLDPDGDYPLRYSWSLVSVPTGSSADLNGADTSTPTFVADAEGDYVVELAVMDSEGNPGALDRVTVSAFNTRPVADAGPDQAVVLVDSVVQLDGTRSYDSDGDPITHAWTLGTPAGSAATLDDAASATPIFTVDVKGDYVATLLVTDAFQAVSEADAVTVSFQNLVPVADAGPDLAVRVGDPVLLDGRGSSDANGDPLTYRWSLVTVPTGSAASIGQPDAAMTSFVADLSGVYVVDLIVTDGVAPSAPDSAEVTATAAEGAVVDTLRDAVDVINGLDLLAFRNRSLQRNMSRHVGQALRSIDQRDYDGARSRLVDVLRRTDGCASQGTPDPNDWIRDCAAQLQVCAPLTEAIGLLDEIMAR